MPARNDYKTQFDLKQRIFIQWEYIALISILLCVIALFHWRPDQGTWHDIANGLIDILLTLWTALFAIVIIDNYYQKKVSDGLEKHLKEEIFNLLTVRDSSIIQYYNELKIKDITKNCTEVLCGHFSTDYFKYFESILNIKNIRKDFSNTITVKYNDERSNLIVQTLRYTKISRTAPQPLKIYFAYKPGALESTMNDNSYFFREELNYQPFIDRLVASEGKTLLEAMKLKVKFNDDPCPIAPEEITVTHDKVLGGFRIEIGNTPSASRTDDGKYYTYSASVSCCYPAEKVTTLYFVFPEPTLGNTQVSITFDSRIMEDISRVNNLTMISGSDYTLAPIPDHNMLRFSTHSAIFPRSGIVFYW